MGTIGYMSPETAFTPRRSKESDVYSYGVVLLELITRKMALDPSFPENTDIVNWVSSAVNNDYEIEAVCDPNLMSELMSSVEMEEVRKVLLLAVRCTAKEAGERPPMRNVVKELIDIKSNSGDLQKQRKSRRRRIKHIMTGSNQRKRLLYWLN
ncbi:Receptor-like protein kinase [Ananas comosus]|uniref:Receptor-like protein kinase n=1 Tax=Ananas comosus TaxID=4615 RepID=A0A199UNL8_ANACO|nr:Receptor-like protein kinase [Ananas comosus]